MAERKPVAWITRNGKHIPIFEDEQISKDNDTKEKQIKENEKSGTEKSMEQAIEKLDVKAIRDIVSQIDKERREIDAKDGEFGYLDSIYGMKKDFYKKYSGVANLARATLKSLSATGYGKNDVFKIKAREALQALDNNFPYGWK